MAELIALVVWAALLTRIAWKVTYPNGRAVALGRLVPARAATKPIGTS